MFEKSMYETQEVANITKILAHKDTGSVLGTSKENTQ